MLLHADLAAAPPAVIIVDDDPHIVAAASRALRPVQLTVLATSNVDDVLQWLSTREIAVLVTDFHMPRLDGLELISIARREQPAAVRVLMTGQQSLATTIDAINRGEIFRYVAKPFDASAFQRVVGEALGQHREQSRARVARSAAARKERYFESLELTHPGICAVERDAGGCYVVPEACSAGALALLGLGRAGLT